MKKIFAVLALALASVGAHAQSSPGLVFGQVPTAQQWNGYFSAKQDVLVAPPYAVYGNPGGGSTYPQFLTIPSCSAAGQALIWTNGTGFGCSVIAGGGNVSTSGTLTSGAVVLGQGAQSVGVLASVNNSILKTDGSGAVSWGTTLPSGLTLPSPTVTGTLGGTSVVPNSALVNASTTVNGTTCTLGATCTVTAAAALVNGSTTISGGTGGRVLYDNSGTLGELATGFSATASAVAQRDANANIFFNNYFGNATATAAAAGTTTLTVASSRFQQLTTSGSNGQTYQLPNATTLTQGPVFKFNNNSAGTLTINNAGGSALYSLPAGGNTECSVLDNSTSNGSWDCHSEIPNNSTWGTSGGIVLNTSLNTTPQISNGVASSTNPVFIPQRGTANNGFSGDSTHLYGIVGGSTVWTATSTGVNSTAIGATTPSTGAFTSLTDTGITGSTQCLHANASGVISGTGSDCGSGSGAVSSVSNSDGTLTFSPTTGAVVGSLALGHANTWSAAQTFVNSGILLLGSSTGATTFTSANSSVTNYTATVPANTGTLAETNLAQTWSAVQTHNSGDFALAGSTSGTTVLNASATASGTATLPANTGTVSELNLAQTWSAAQTFTNSDLLLLGSSTGATTFTSANSSVTNYTVTVPANTGTIAETNLAQTWSAAQTHNSGTFLLAGSTSGTTTLNASATASGTLTLPAATDTLVGRATTDTLTNKTLSAPTLTGTATVASATLSGLLTTTAVQETAVSLSGCNGSTATVNLSSGTYFYCTVSTGATTIAVSNAAATGNVSSFVIELTNGGSQTVTWMTGTKWPGGTAPTLTAAGTDLIVCSTRDGATTWRCVASELNSH